MPDVRHVLVPEGLAGERVDAAVARLFGVSRTRAAELAAGPVVAQALAKQAVDAFTHGHIADLHAVMRGDGGLDLVWRRSAIRGRRSIGLLVAPHGRVGHACQGDKCGKALPDAFEAILCHVGSAKS